VRRVWLVSAVLLAVTLRASSQPPQPPTFRGGTNLVQVDAVVSDDTGRPVTDLTAADFEVLDDGRQVAVDRVRFLGGTEYGGDPVLAPIRTHDDEQREASRDDVRVYAIVLDDYHVTRMNELRVIEPLLAFVRQLPPTDLVAVYYPLDSVTDVAFARDREPVLKAIRAFYGRRGDYSPKHPLEEVHLRVPRDIERIRREITASALEGLATHLGGLKVGRKTVVFVSEGFGAPLTELSDLFNAANRANVAVYPLDPQGMTTGHDRQLTRREALGGVVLGTEMLRTLALRTSGRAIVGRNDVRGALEQVARDASAYYLIAYESPHPGDGKFHRVAVRVKRPRVTIFARAGYWSSKQPDSAIPTAATPLLPAVRAALERLADSLRPDADEPPERRSLIPRSPVLPQPIMLGAPTVSIVRGRTVSDVIRRREFSRTDTLRIRAAIDGNVAVGARLLARDGRPLTDLPASVASAACEVTLPLGSLGPGDYVIELAGRAGEQAAQQYVAFRILR
jgi:VWFA-related protein